MRASLRTTTRKATKSRFVRLVIGPRSRQQVCFGQLDPGTMIKLLSLLQNVGKFDNVTAGANLPLSKLTVIYAENARGKTTLSAIFRSLSSGLAGPIL